MGRELPNVNVHATPVASAWLGQRRCVQREDGKGAHDRSGYRSRLAQRAAKGTVWSAQQVVDVGFARAVPTDDLFLQFVNHPVQLTALLGHLVLELDEACLDAI